MRILSRKTIVYPFYFRQKYVPISYTQHKRVGYELTVVHNNSAAKMTFGYLLIHNPYFPRSYVGETTTCQVSITCA